MSYPTDLWTSDQPANSARFRPASTPPDIDRSNGNRAHYLATGASTDGQFGLYLWEMGAGPTGPEPHFHRSFSESFYVLDGTVRLFDGNGWTEARRGDFLFVPPGGVHAFRNESGAPASMLLLFAPGAPREEYFERVVEAASWSEEERAAFFLRHDTYWV